MLVSARTLITQALRTLQVIGEGDPPSSKQIEDGFGVLGELVEGLNLEPGLGVFLRRLTYTLTPSVASYTIGPTGTLVSALLVDSLDHAAYIQPGQTNEIPVHVYPDRTPYELITIKSQTGTIPLSLLLEPTEPNETITLWPVPTEAGTLVLYALSRIQAFADLDTTYQLPQGFAQLFRLQLSVDLGPWYHMSADDDTRAALERLRGSIKRKNERIPDSTTDPMLTGAASFGSVYDFYAGRG